MSAKPLPSITGRALGDPLPPSPHAVSVSLPTWADVIGYEEGDPRVINAMTTGYPRFFYNPITRKLFAQAEIKFAREGEFCLVFPSERVARLCVAFCLKQSAFTDASLHQSLRIHPFADETWAVVLPKAFEAIAKSFWQHAGFIVSSRQAERALERQTAPTQKKDVTLPPAKHIIISRIASLSGGADADVFLFPSGMAAIFSAFEIVTQPSPGQEALSTIQLGFPYVDTLKIQEKFGHRAFFLPYTSAHALTELESIITENKIGAVFIEFPCNPMLECIELEQLSVICRRHAVALVVDNTLSTWANIDLTPYADIVVSSLTKFFSGTGDVLAGSLALNASSPFYAELKTRLQSVYEDMLFDEDAAVLEHNSRDFDIRIRRINETAEKLYDFLASRISKPDALYFTKGNPTYDKYKKLGYGGIISIVLASTQQAQRFYDALDIVKGPSLGTNYTIACPYTMLAHYHERAFAEHAGVPFQLIRVSVGLEDFEELSAKFGDALDVAMKRL